MSDAREKRIADLVSRLDAANRLIDSLYTVISDRGAKIEQEGNRAEMYKSQLAKALNRVRVNEIKRELSQDDSDGPCGLCNAKATDLLTEDHCERCCLDQMTRERDELRAENERLRELLYKTTRTPFGLCNFSHLHNGGQCGECEACEHTKEVMKSVREALEGGQ